MDQKRLLGFVLVVFLFVLLTPAAEMAGQYQDPITIDTADGCPPGPRPTLTTY